MERSFRSPEPGIGIVGLSDCEVDRPEKETPSSRSHLRKLSASTQGLTDLVCLVGFRLPALISLEQGLVCPQI